TSPMSGTMSRMDLFIRYLPWPSNPIYLGTKNKLNI
ncbi:MAG: hypothetical protein ACI906_005176, partial [Candidatus Latescibacterota bacterium]